jgi:hypothetical protein
MVQALSIIYRDLYSDTARMIVKTQNQRFTQRERSL